MATTSIETTPQGSSALTGQLGICSASTPGTPTRKPRPACVFSVHWPSHPISDVASVTTTRYPTVQCLTRHTHTPQLHNANQRFALWPLQQNATWHGLHWFAQRWQAEPDPLESHTQRPTVARSAVPERDASAVVAQHPHHCSRKKQVSIVVSDSPRYLFPSLSCCKPQSCSHCPSGLRHAVVKRHCDPNEGLFRFLPHTFEFKDDLWYHS
jgi:hypothetical protein